MRDKDKKRVPFDREYATTYKSEVRWLAQHGIRYTFVKEINTLTTYKYKKNSKLYQCLADFYKSLEDKAMLDKFYKTLDDKDMEE